MTSSGTACKGSGRRVRGGEEPLALRAPPGTRVSRPRGGPEGPTGIVIGQGTPSRRRPSPISRRRTGIAPCSRAGAGRQRPEPEHISGWPRFPPGSSSCRSSPAPSRRPWPPWRRALEAKLQETAGLLEALRRSSGATAERPRGAPGSRSVGSRSRSTAGRAGRLRRQEDGDQAGRASRHHRQHDGLELAEFVEAFKEKFNVTAAVAARWPPRRRAAAPCRGPAEESRTSSTSSSRPPATRRSRSSRPCARSPAWASRRPRTWWMAPRSTVKEAASKDEANADQGQARGAGREGRPEVTAVPVRHGRPEFPAGGPAALRGSRS
jgi:hypothetical protein